MSGTKKPRLKDGRDAVWRGVLKHREQLAKEGGECQDRAEHIQGKMIKMWEQCMDYILNNWLSFINIIIMPIIVVIWNKKMELCKTELNKDIENHKSNLSFIYDRKSSFSKKQLDILEDLWERFIELGWVCCEIIDMNVQYRKVYKMNEQQFIDYIKNNDDIEKIDKDSILNSSNGRYIFITKMMNKHIDEKIKMIQCFMKHLDKKGIFITPEIKDKFNNVQEILRIAMEIYRHNVEGIKK